MSLLLLNKRRKTSSTPPSSDPHWNNVVLYLKGDGADGSTNIIDSSLSAKTVSVITTTTISTAQSKYGGSSIFFNSGYLQLAANTDFQFPSSFTIESWIYCNNTDSFSTIIEAGTFPNSLIFRQEGTTGGNLYIQGTTFINNFSDELNGNVWRHFAICRNSSNLLSLYINGILYNSATASGTVNPSNGIVRIGNSVHLNNQQWNGYMDSFRITKGVARYTTNFNPETDTYLN
jgi:hypothetical protein